MNNSIAIIGVSFDLPKIKNWDDLEKALYNKQTFIDEMPANRLNDIEEAFGTAQMAKAGYIKEIDKFDNDYFNLTKRESVKIVPEHRLFLSNAIKAFYHAGYSEASLKESKTGIFFTTSTSAYLNFAHVSDLSFNSFDLVEGIEGTRLAKFLDTRGPVVAINTTCSSSLVAINAAKHSLNSYECDMALVGGVKILSVTEESAKGIVIHSKTGECKPFDQDADGTMNGEGAIFFVLKRYDQAVKDGDAILGEIKGIAVNHGGNRISSLTAPSSEAQRDVIVQAWENAAIDLEKIKFIEAHGTGTILGDPIEIKAIKQAFKQYNPAIEKSPCAISSFKGQIGHLDYLSGLAGLLRLVAALNFKKIPLQSNFSQLNQYFDLKETGLYIPETTEAWESEDKERIGGVSSFGLTGTNVHIVVSQSEKINSEQHTEKPSYLQLSHTDRSKLNLYKKYLAEKIEAINNVEELDKFCLKLNKVFQLKQVNQGITYSSKASLIQSLKSEEPSDDAEKLFLLLDLDLCTYSKEFIASIFIENLFIKQQWDKHITIPLSELSDQKTINIFFQFVLYKYLFEKLGNKIKLISSKEGSILNDLIKSKITIQQIIDQENNIESQYGNFNEDKFREYLQKNVNSEAITILDFSQKDKNRFNDLNLKLSVIKGSFSDDIDRFQLYSNILSINSNPLLTSNNPIIYESGIPYFNAKRFWPKLTQKANVTEEVSKEENKKPELVSFEAKELKSIITNVWTNVLETADFKDNEDFFDLGGTSLSVLDMIDDLEKNIAGIKIPYEEIYSYSTVSLLYEMIAAQLTITTSTNKSHSELPLPSRNEARKIIREIWTSILETEDFLDDDDFFDLGGTSLSTLDMTDELEKKIPGIKISYEEVYSYTTVSKILDKITELQNASTIEPQTQLLINPEHREENYGKIIEQIKKEHFVKEVPENLFITGGTGLLGMAVIHYLIKNTNAKLYCLVRKKEFDSSKERFWSIFGKYYDLEVSPRIEIIEGDLMAKQMNISGAYDKKFGKIDMIFHVAGSPEFISKKKDVEHINYVGTKNVVDWANKWNIKKLNFISTIGIVGKTMPAEVLNFYETDTNLGQDPGSYIHASSKLKAEEYILQEYKHKSKIFRISNIGGSYENGTFATDLSKNLMWIKLKTLSELKFYYDELLEGSSNINFFPVDIISKLITEISFTKIDVLNTFHLHAGRPFSNRAIFNSFKEVGIDLKAISKEEFTAFMENNQSRMNFYNVATEANKYIIRNDATDEIIQKLKLNKKYETSKYIQKLLTKNLALTIKT